MSVTLFYYIHFFIIGVIQKKMKKNRNNILLLDYIFFQMYYAFECFLNILKIIAIFIEKKKSSGLFSKATSIKSIF